LVCSSKEALQYAVSFNMPLSQSSTRRYNQSRRNLGQQEEEEEEPGCLRKLLTFSALLGIFQCAILAYQVT